MAGSLVGAVRAFLDDLLNGATTVWSLVANGTEGGTPSPSPVAGEVRGNFLRAMSDAGNATVGVGQAVPKGYLYRDMVPIAGGRVHVAGGAATLVYGFNVHLAHYTAVGLFTMTLEDAVTQFFHISVNPLTATRSMANAVPNADGTSLDVYLTDPGGVALDADFTFLVYGT